MTVTVDHVALRRAWVRAQYGEILLQVRGDVPDLMVRAAADAANEEAAAAGRADDTFGEPGGEGPDGPVLLLSRTGQAEALRAWLESFAAQLEAAGVDARVGPARPARLPKWLDAGQGQPLRLTALGALPTHPGARSEWTATEETTQELARNAVAWGHTPDGTTYLGRGMHTQVVPDELPGLDQALAGGVLRQGQVDLTRVRASPVRVTKSSMSVPAEVGYQVWDDDQSWEQTVDELLEALIAQADLFNLAVVERHPTLMTTWHNVGTHWNLLPHVEGYEVRGNFHLLDSYVHDARGVMLLTDAHLARAHDLSAWTVEPVRPSRYVLRARDLTPWLAGDHPDPAVLQRARADFGGMLLRRQVLG